MRKILTDTVTKYSLIGALSILILGFFDLYQTTNHQSLINQKTNIPQKIKGETSNLSALSIEKLQYKPTLKFQDRLPSFQMISSPQHVSKKSKILHEILSNAQKRKKFEYVVNKAMELHLPSELALIPVIESEYNTNAISNKGAGGIWQLMPATAHIFGVSSKQRFEFKSATRAALLHFKDLYNEFGNWEFAIAAYNAGDGRVSKALRKNAHAKTIKDLKLPRETRNYVLSFYQLKKEMRFSDATNSIRSTA